METNYGGIITPVYLVLESVEKTIVYVYMYFRTNTCNHKKLRAVGKSDQDKEDFKALQEGAPVQL